MTQIVKIAVVRAHWQTPRTDVLSLADWSDEVLKKIFEVRNGWSFGSYWDDCSLNLRRPEFTFFDLGILNGVQPVKMDRGVVLPAARAQCLAQNIPLDAYDQFILLVSPTGNDSGASGRDALLDQNAEHEFFAHEIGHVLGLDHPFGWGDAGGGHIGPVEYQDDYCLMGFTGPKSAEMMPPADTSVVTSFPAKPKSDVDPKYFWRSGRMPSAATLCHHWPEFRATPGYLQIASGQVGEIVTLTALSERQLGGPLLLQMTSQSGAMYFVEYRLNTNWDRGIGKAAIVIHSVGAHDAYLAMWRLPGIGRVWFSYAIEAPFYDAWSGPADLGLEVVSISGDQKKATIRLTGSSNQKGAQLVEQRGRLRINERSYQSAALLLSKENDPSLCSPDLKSYLVEIRTFGEQVEFELVLNGFSRPAVEQWRINGRVLVRKLRPHLGDGLRRAL